MKSTSIRVLVAAFAVLIATLVANAQAQDDAPLPPQAVDVPMHGHGFGGGALGFFGRGVNLTDDQRAEMKNLAEAQRPAMKALFVKQHQVDEQIRRYVQGSYDAAKVQALATQKARIQAQITVAESRLRNQMYQLLTSDQQARVKELQANREARRAQHMQDEPPASPMD